MTADEEKQLKNYLVRTGAISSEEEFATSRYEFKASKFKATLAEAKAYAMGCADVLLLKEAMASTYDGIIKNLAEVLMSDRKLLQREISNPAKPPPEWMYLPVGPEGPRPWPDST